MRPFMKVLAILTLGLSCCGLAMIPASASSGRSQIRMVESPVPNAEPFSDSGLSGVTGPSAISCGALTSCIAIGTDTSRNSASWLTRDDGRTWTEVVLSAQPTLNVPADVSCHGKRCVVIGAFGALPGAWVSSDGGTTWLSTRDFGRPQRGAFPVSLSCSTEDACVAVGTDGSGWSTLNGGAAWVSHPLPEAFARGADRVAAVSCASPRVCFAVGQTQRGHGVVIRTTNGGATWTVLAFSTDTAFYSIACPSSQRCVVGLGRSPLYTSQSSNVVFRTVDGGLRWIRSPLPIPTSYVSSISCPTTTNCTAVGWHGGYSSPGSTPVALVTKNGGVTWMATVAANAHKLNGVACSQGRDCVVVGSDSSGSGASWLRSVS